MALLGNGVPRGDPTKQKSSDNRIQVSEPGERPSKKMENRMEDDFLILGDRVRCKLSCPGGKSPSARLCIGPSSLFHTYYEGPHFCPLGSSSTLGEPGAGPKRHGLDFPPPHPEAPPPPHLKELSERQGQPFSYMWVTVPSGGRHDEIISPEPGIGEVQAGSLFWWGNPGLREQVGQMADHKPCLSGFLCQS